MGYDNIFKLDNKLLEEKIEELQPWRQDIEFCEGIRTGSGKISNLEPKHKWNDYKKYLPEDLTGKSVLDVGCNSGYITVQCKLRNASRVLGVDAMEKNIRQAELVSEFFNANVEWLIQDAHLYTLTTDEQFDYIIFSNLFYHLRYPTLVLDRLAEMTKSILIFNTPSVGNDPVITPEDDYERNSEKSFDTINGYPKMYFVEKYFAQDFSNWWFPNESCCFSLLRASGMKVIDHPREGLFICEPNRQRNSLMRNNTLFKFPKSTSK